MKEYLSKSARSLCGIVIAASCVVAGPSAQAAEKQLPIKGEVFTVRDRRAVRVSDGSAGNRCSSPAIQLETGRCKKDTRTATDRLPDRGQNRRSGWSWNQNGLVGFGKVRVWDKEAETKEYIDGIYREGDTPFKQEQIK